MAPVFDLPDDHLAPVVLNHLEGKKDKSWTDLLMPGRSHAIAGLAARLFCETEPGHHENGARSVELRSL